MRQTIGWLVAVVGLGGALLTGCNEQASNTTGRFSDPARQKYQSASPSESTPGAGMEGSGTGGSGQDISQSRNIGEGTGNSKPTEEQGPYSIGRPQPVPRERGTAPLGVGSGRNTSRQMAQEQLKSE